ncbi:MAG TPA: hypothetical protein VKV28_02240 [Candidatus Binataceae bacterium]|nr:hypothetical protein [Candidatus Binataceae bacterium]
MNAADRLVQEILSNIGIWGAKQLAVWSEPRKEVDRVWRIDYRAALRRQLDDSLIKSFAQEMSAVLPAFNQESFLPSASLFSRIAKSENFQLKSSEYRSDGGLALRGFYVDCVDTHLKKPIVFLNLAHHPVAVGTTFAHELGHHVSSELLRPSRTALRPYFHVDCVSHLEEPCELLADIAAALCGYPHPVASMLFGSARGRHAASTKGFSRAAFQRVRAYVKKQYGFDFDQSGTVFQSLQYLCGMIHYAKLREALFGEFGV